VTPSPQRRLAALWWTATAIVAVIMFLLGTNDTVYNLTSPAALDIHVLLRKTYSIVAFGVTGYLAARASLASGWRTSPLTVALWLALFSLAIEIEQDMSPPRESLALHSFDIACGAIGGWLGAVVARR
jgi:FtsH-binding integral membrane protein